MTFLTVVENLKIGEIASQLSFQRLMEFGYFGAHFSVTRSKAARAFFVGLLLNGFQVGVKCFPVLIRDIF